MPSLKLPPFKAGCYIRWAAHAIHFLQEHRGVLLAAGQDPTSALEELAWLARMGAHLLADCGDGETPLAPMPVAAAAAAAAQQPGACPVEALSHALLGVAGLCLDERARPLVSPRRAPHVASHHLCRITVWQCSMCAGPARV